MKYMERISDSLNETENASCVCTIFSLTPENTGTITTFVVVIIFLILIMLSLIPVFIQILRKRYNITPKYDRDFHQT